MPVEIQGTRLERLATIAAMAGTSFDRAADYYDATRGLPDEVVAQVTDLLSQELKGTGLSLEIGVGTGRIALPLTKQGIELIGADLAPAMLSKLKANSPGKVPLALLNADVADLPLATSSVGGVIACHVLHLIPDWRRVLDEVGRVVRPGGILLLDFGGPTDKPWSRECELILERHGVLRTRPGVSSPKPVVDYLGRRASVRRLRPIRFDLEVSLEEELTEWENQLLAWTWQYDRDRIRLACDEIRCIAASRGWDVGEPVLVGSVIQWWGFDFAD